MSDPLTVILKAEEIRAEIGRLLRRLQLSRQLLKLAEKSERYRDLESAHSIDRREAPHAS